MATQFSNGAADFEALFDSYLGLGVPKAGEIRSGYIVDVRNSAILVDIAAKSEGVIPSEEIDTFTKKQKADMVVGREIRVCVVDPEDERGNIILSYLKVAEQEDWQRAEELAESDDVVEVPVIGFNRGGLLVRLGSLRGFVPASQLGYDNQINRGQSAESQLKPLIGNEMTCKVLEASQEKGRLILSELAADKVVRASARAERMAELEEGQVHVGRVINLTDFGAFIDIDGIEGLVHSSELSWKHFNKPSNVLSVGDEVKVQIIGIDRAKQRVTFSIKRLESNPWEQLDGVYKEGQLVEVTVTQLTRYGAFARINDDFRLEGLIHISELASDHVGTPDEVVKKGQTLTARIIRLDGENRQIGFSIKQVDSAEYMEMDLAQAN